MKKIILVIAVLMINCPLIFGKYCVMWVKLTNNRALDDTVTACVVIKTVKAQEDITKDTVAVYLDIFDNEEGVSAQVTSYGHTELHELARKQCLQDYLMYRDVFHAYQEDCFSIGLYKKIDGFGRNTQIMQECGPFARVLFDGELTALEVETAYEALKDCVAHCEYGYCLKTCITKITVPGAHNISGKY